MKIVITQFGAALIEGGITAFIFELSNALISHGHEVYVISGRDLPKSSESIKDMFGVERLPKIITLDRCESIWQSKISKALFREVALWGSVGSSLIRKISPDMTIINGAAPIFSQSFKVTVCHDLEFRGKLWSSILMSFYDKLLYQTFNKVATTSSELAQNAPSKLGVDFRKVVTIPICVDTSKFENVTKKNREHAILHVGTWSDKNLTTTIKAFLKLAKIDPKIKLYIVGLIDGYNKEMLSKVNPDAKKRIICVGKISKVELRNLYSRVKVTSVPSTYQIPVLSPTVLESLSSGTPVIGGSTAISTDLLIEGYNGYRVFPTDYNSLFSRLLFISRNDEVWFQLSKNARSMAAKFDANVVSKQYVDLYNRFLSETHK